MQDPNPPAFARQFSEDIQGEVAHEAQEGMSLRDYFAGQALAALARITGANPQGVAEWAYACADAMLIERARALSEDSALNKFAQEFREQQP